MIDVSQWRASIGLWNYSQAASSRPAIGHHSHSFKAAVDSSKSGSTTSGEKTSKLPAALSLIALLLLLFLSLSLLRHILMIPPTGNCYQVQCTTGVTVTDTNYLQSIVLPGGSSSNLIYNDLYLIVCLRMLLLLSGVVELNPGPTTDKAKSTEREEIDSKERLGESRDAEHNPGPITGKQQLMLSKELNMAAVIQIFGSSAHHYMTIGAGLNVKTADLMLIPGAADTNLNLVQKKIRKNWQKLLQGNCYQVQCTTGITNLTCNSLVCLRMLLLLSGDVELNPGPTTDKKPDLAAVKQIFDSSDDHYLTIGAGLKVKTADLIEMQGTASTKLHLVFKRWFDADRDVNWDTLIKLCDDNPDKLGKAKSNLLAYIESSGVTHNTFDREPHSSIAAAGNDKKSNPPPDVSKYCPKLKDKIKYKSFTDDLVKDINIVLVTATDVEFNAVMGQATPINGEKYTQTRSEGITFYIAMYGNYKVAIIRTEQGKEVTSEELQKIQKVVKAQYVIAIGICYGMKEDKKKTKFGSILIASRVKEVSIARYKDGGKSELKIEDYRSGKTLYDIFKSHHGFALDNGINYDVNVLTGEDILVTESSLNTSQEHKDEIQRQVPQALGGEMEAAAILGKPEEFEGIVIKAIADWGDMDKASCAPWKEFSTYAAAKYVWYQLSIIPEVELMRK
uniref:Nucleoside phosphorylase domain-containing protein n=1 Tax=Amphimedon queenslandica TaxID=400682 RepID=A0A1X7TXP9_AMPQE